MAAPHLADAIVLRKRGVERMTSTLVGDAGKQRLYRIPKRPGPKTFPLAPLLLLAIEI